MPTIQINKVLSSPNPLLEASWNQLEPPDLGTRLQHLVPLSDWDLLAKPNRFRAEADRDFFIYDALDTAGLRKAGAQAQGYGN